MAESVKLLCWTCGKSFARGDSLAKHVQKHNGVEYACNICDKLFSQKDNLKRHKQTTHELKIQHQCSICGKTFPRKDSLTKHEKVHSISGHKCSSCRKEFTSKDQLDQHIRKRHAKHCECGKKFTRGNNLIRHKKLCRPKTNESKQKTCPATRSKNLKQCEICHKQFSRWDSLRRHQREIHMQGKYGCPFCGLSFSRHNLQQHVEICAKKTVEKTPLSVKERVEKHRTVGKLKKMLPESPKSKAQHIQSLIDTPTRKTRKHLENAGILKTKEDEEELKMYRAMFQDYKEVDNQLKSKRSDAVRCHRRNVSAEFLGTHTKKAKKWKKATEVLSTPKLHRKIQKGKIHEQLISGSEAVFADVMRKSRGEKIPLEWKDKIGKYWTTNLSHPTSDSKRNKIRKRMGRNQYVVHNRHVMMKSYRESYCAFVKENPDVKVSEATFRRLKPFFVKPPTARDLEQCCCMKCVSVRKAHRAMMNFRQRQQIDLPIFNTVYELVESTLCPKENNQDQHNIECIKQKCEQCGLKKLKFDEIEMSNEENSKVKWHKFEYVENQWKSKTGEIKTAKHLELVPKCTPPKELSDHLKNVLIDFPYHLFTSSWQRRQWGELLQNLPADHAAIEMDFSENFTTLFQEEVQSLHWTKSQCTIHSCVLWRPSVPDDRTADTHVKEHWLIISEDLKHDHCFVNHNLVNIILPKLKEIGSEVTTLHQKTDGCAAQYKSRHVFGDVSRAEEELGVKRKVNFCASGHGKGEVDSAAGFVKTEAKRAITSNIDLHIANAKDLYEFADTNLAGRDIPTNANLHKRRFFFVGRDEVARDGNQNLYKTIKDTRKIHYLHSMGTDGKIASRELSCYCFSCLHENYDQCQNKDHVMPLEEKVFSNFDGQMDTEDEEEEQPVYTDFSAMIAKDSVVAIKPSSDSFLMYYLLHVTSNGVEVLSQDTTNLGHTYFKGMNMLRGYYYNNTKLTKAGLVYKKDKNTDEVLVPKESVLYVGIQLKESRKQGELILSHFDHDDIICYVSGF